MQPTIEHIVEHFQAGLQRLCLGYAYDPEEAKDLVQEVFVKVRRCSGDDVYGL